jgi:hypothetical protein
MSKFAQFSDTFNKSSADLVSLGRKHDIGTYFVVPFILFVLLSPGLIISIPPTVPYKDKTAPASLFATGHSTFLNTFFHGIVFLLLFWAARAVIKVAGV